MFCSKGTGGEFILKSIATEYLCTENGLNPATRLLYTATVQNTDIINCWYKIAGHVGRLGTYLTRVLLMWRKKSGFELLRTETGKILKRWIFILLYCKFFVE